MASSRRRSGICCSGSPASSSTSWSTPPISMIGNRSPRHVAFGWAAARFDDLLNFVPARLSALLIAATACLIGFDARSAAAIARRDAPKHKSPNAGWPEAAVAGALGLALGGPRRYGAEEVDGAWLNPGARTAATPRRHRRRHPPDRRRLGAPRRSLARQVAPRRRRSAGARRRCRPASPWCGRRD